MRVLNCASALLPHGDDFPPGGGPLPRSPLSAGLPNSERTTRRLGTIALCSPSKDAARPIGSLPCLNAGGGASARLGRCDAAPLAERPICGVPLSEMAQWTPPGGASARPLVRAST
eukprot:5718978-Prymnesium_polylepis.1